MRRLPVHSALVLCLFAGAASARQSQSFPPARPENGSGESLASAAEQALARVERVGSSIAERELVPVLERKELDPSQRARLERKLGESYLDLGRRADADACFSRSLAAAIQANDRDQAGWARRLAGTVAYGDGRVADARALWDAARDDFVATGDALGEFEVLDDMAVAVTGLEKRPYLERCLVIAHERRDVLLEARARRRWGQGLLEAARPGPALIELERAVSVFRALGPAAGQYLGDALAVLGWALRAHGSNDRAVPVHSEAIRLAIANRDIDGQIWNYFGLGLALTELGRYAEADRALAKGRALAERTGSLTTIRLLSDSEGFLALRRREWARAAREIERSVARPGADLTVMPLVSLSEAYRHLGRNDDALATANRAVDLARRLGLADNELFALTAVADAFEARGEIARAEATLRDVLERLEAYRASLAPTDFLKQGFHDRFTAAYGSMVHLLMRQGRDADALAAAERVRSRAFADLLAGRRLKEREQSDSARWLLGGGGHGEEIAATGADSPVSVPALDADGMVSLARRLSTTIVAYWVHRSGSYAWVVRSDGSIRGARLPLDPDTLQSALRHTVDVVPTLRVSGGRAVSAAGYSRLYDVLWAPIAAWVPASPGHRVTIIPHGPLFACPFAALRDHGGTYLIERHALHQAPSGTVLLEALERRATEPVRGGRALLVADPPTTSRTTTSLDAARREIRVIAQLVGMPADSLAGDRASEDGVRQVLPRARIVHFATHAFVRETDPLGSHLALAGSPNGGEARDGRLTASEVSGMTLAADLVVLAACRSARGPVSSDGIAGLTRAFMAAGAPSVVATLWDISDEPTARLMTRFYAAYATGQRKDDALRAAQLAVLRDLRKGRLTATVGGVAVTYPEHPWLWAAPVLVGAP